MSTGGDGRERPLGGGGREVSAGDDGEEDCGSGNGGGKLGGLALGLTPASVESTQSTAGS